MRLRVNVASEGDEVKLLDASPEGAVGQGGHVVVSGVTKTFRRARQSRLVLEKIDLELEAGEFVCLLGPSGCGKSTLLNIIAGFQRADQGKVMVGGRLVTKPGADRCVMFQKPTLFPWMTVLDNVLFGPRAQRKRTKEARAKALDLLLAFGLSGFERHYPHQLSGGMQHRVAVARALMNQPSLLLMDEPFAALDAITRARMQEFLLDLWERERMTVLFVTHDLEEAILLADRVCVMSPRPGTIHHQAEVRLTRPRSQATVESLEFLELRRAIRSTIKGDSQ